jgi:CRISPR/Cas system endoribonuclease Cas6 (RAMP superfamily)
MKEVLIYTNYNGFEVASRTFRFFTFSRLFGKIEYLKEGHISFRSPITAYSTLLTPDDKKKTYYYHPREHEFTDMVQNNLKKKAYFNSNLEELPFSLWSY